MKKIFTLLLVVAAGLSACRKDDQDPDIKQYDEQQMQAYIKANNLTDFQRDKSLGQDTSGMYYKILNAGTGKELEYSDRVSFVFTLKSFDGKYNAADTIFNQYEGYLGQIAQSNLPIGLQSALHNILKYRDGSMRLLIPSHLAYGVKGVGTGSITNTNNRIAGNQGLEYYVHVINNQQVYDDLVIRNYMTANNLSGFTKTTDGIYYKINTAGTPGSINELSTITATYTGTLLNGTVFDKTAETTATSFPVYTFNVEGLSKTLKAYAGAGTSITVIIPSRLAYGANPPSTVIPKNAPLRFDYQITTVTQP